MRKYLQLVLVPALLFAMVAAAGAEVTAQSFSVSPYVGGYHFLGKENLDMTAVFGVRAGYNVTSHFGVEGVIDYANSDGRASYGYDIHNYNWHLDALYHFMPERRLVPYLVAGYGWQDRRLPRDNATTRTGFNYGFGAKFFVNPALAVRGDFRHMILKHDDSTYNNVEYTIGVDFLFNTGQPAAQPTPAATAPATATQAAEPTTPTPARAGTAGAPAP